MVGRGEEVVSVSLSGKTVRDPLWVGMGMVGRCSAARGNCSLGGRDMGRVVVGMLNSGERGGHV